MMAGLPDIFACVPIDGWTEPVDSDNQPTFNRLGLLVGIETKMPGNHPSPIQEHRHAEIRASSGLVCVAHSVDEALAFIDWVQAGQPPS